MSRKSNGIASSVPFLWRTVILVPALLVNTALCFRLLWGEQSLAEWHTLKATHARMLEELRGLDLLRADLSREIRLLQTDDAYVEKVIRQRLNYVRPNEILYLFDDAGQEDSPWTGTDDGSVE